MERFNGIPMEIFRLTKDQLVVTPLHFGTSFHFPDRFNGIPMEVFRLVPMVQKLPTTGTIRKPRTHAFMVVFLLKPVSGLVYLGSVDIFIYILYRYKSRFAFNLCVLH